MNLRLEKRHSRKMHFNLLKKGHFVRNLNSVFEDLFY